MKRFICLILSLVFCLSVTSVLAEGVTYEVQTDTTSDYSNDEVGITIPDIKLPEVVLKEEARTARNSDDVVKQDNVYTIKTPSRLSIKLNAASLPSFQVLTQSYYSSLDVYSRFSSDADATSFIDNMIDENVHIVIWDAYEAFKSILVESVGTSALSQHVGNLSTLRQSDLEAVASQIAIDNSFTEYSLYSFNGNTWIMLGDYVLLTIVNSEVVIVDYYPNGDSMTSDDYDDYTLFMKALTLS